MTAHLDYLVCGPLYWETSSYEPVVTEHNQILEKIYQADNNHGGRYTIVTPNTIGYLKMSK